MPAELSQALRPVSSDSHPWVIASPATERHVLVRDSARFTGKPEVTTHILSFLLASDFPEAGLETIAGRRVLGRVRDCFHQSAEWLNSNGRPSLDSDQTPESEPSLLPVSASPL